MLTRLRIQDLAIIEEVELELGPGLNVLTGETGAGKSIIVGAAGLLRGGRMPSELVRRGAQEASVEALFDLAGLPEAVRRLEEAGLPGGEELLVRRVGSAAGRGRVYVNGTLCTVQVLSGITARLIDISGQHEHQLLSDRQTHRELLDAFGVPPALVEGAGVVHARLRELSRALEQSRLDDRQRSQRIDFLRFQLAELEAASLRAGEDDELEAERTRLLRAGELAEAAAHGEEALSGAEDAVAPRLARLRRQLEGLAAVDPALAPLAAQIEEARILLEDTAQSLRRYGAAIEHDPARLAAIDERLDLLHRLGRKHGRTVAEMIEQQGALAAELSQLDSLEERRDALEAELARARAEAARELGRLSEAREEAAARLGREVTARLAELGMPGARLVPEVGPQAAREGDDPALVLEGRRASATGWDRVELLFAPGPGEEPLPLARIASGGELSRVSLAIRLALGAGDPVATSIYDEVDAGIGGAVADKVGRALAEVARHRQVVCVTHLPQVAAHADSHFSVGKHARKGRARTAVRRLSEEERVEELARMLGGEVVTEAARANALKLLEGARAAGRRRREGEKKE
jgi:DNA repair protein RecN (Recombination protein N)